VQGEESVGGLVGSNLDKIDQSFTEGDVLGKDNVGGIVSTSTGPISNVYSHDGSVTGHNSVGGIVGTNNGTLERTYSTMEIKGNNKVGGIIGENNSSKVSNLLAANTSIDGQSNNVRRVIGSGTGIDLVHFPNGALAFAAIPVKGSPLGSSQANAQYDGASATVPLVNAIFSNDIAWEFTSMPSLPKLKNINLQPHVDQNPNTSYVLPAGSMITFALPVTLSLELDAEEDEDNSSKDPDDLATDQDAEKELEKETDPAGGNNDGSLPEADNASTTQDEPQSENNQDEQDETQFTQGSSDVAAPANQTGSEPDSGNNGDQTLSSHQDDDTDAGQGDQTSSEPINDGTTV
jgi:hypothetical protein